MKCFLDIWECYSLNEITIYYEINDAKAKIAFGEQPVFDNVDALFAELEAD